jgi:type II secretory pathway component GspD/PulD (secretin)
VVALLDDVTNGPPYNASAGNDNSQPGLPGAASLSPAAGAFYNAGNNGDLRGRTENIFNRVLGSLLSSQGGATVQFSILDDTQLNILFRAIEKNIDNTIVNAPRLTIFNNQRANLTLVNQVSYVKDYDVEVAQTAFIADPLVDVVQDGLTLDVKPTVSHDRKYVTLEVQPTVATLVRPIRTFESNLSGLTTAVVIELPEIRYSQAATTVRVPDGGYVVIGGLKTVSTVDRRSETPVLSDIPIISFLFSRKGRSDEIRDLIIVLHVSIIDLTEAESTLAK